MFTHSAPFYDALHSSKDYGAAVRAITPVLETRAPAARSLLDVGCGTGRHLELLRDRYEVEGLDLNPDLLEVARARCPGVPLHVADMADFSLGRRFDVVLCMFSAIAYVRTEARMRRTVRTMRDHLEPGGLLLVELWFPAESRSGKASRRMSPTSARASATSWDRALEQPALAGRQRTGCPNSDSDAT